MFTGIVKHLGTIARLETSPTGGKLTVRAPSLAPDLALSASVAVNGCCLTVVDRDSESFSADLSAETVSKTSFDKLKNGALVNLERPLTAGDEFGGHFVLGHVDGTGRVSHLNAEGYGWNFGVEVPHNLARYVVSKGSITIDGVSLTVARRYTYKHFSVAEVAVIPYTYGHTNIRNLAPGDVVNLEADILGKYIERYLQQRSELKSSVELTVGELVRQGF